MRPLLRLTPALLSLAVASALRAAAPVPDAEGFVPLFNGRDFTGWTNVNCAPETWSIKDGVIHSTGLPIGCLRTTRQYENFILELEWRHLKRSGNSGIFVWGSPINAPGVPFLRGIEVQALDNGYAEDFEQKNGKKSDWFTVHGDVFAIHGASMKYIGRTNGKRSFPIEDRSKPSPEWNHYRIVANHGSLRLHVNGKEVSGGDEANYRKGYLGLESEGSPVEFRNLRIKELPSTGASPEVTAPLDPGWKALFNGLDLRGWRDAAGAVAHWTVGGGRITRKPTPGEEAPLWTEAQFGAAEFVVDYQPPKTGTPGAAVAEIMVRGQRVTLGGAESGKFSRFTVTVERGTIRVQRDSASPVEQPLPSAAPARAPFGLVAADAGGTFTNLHARNL
ncbi:MAG: DUF1080 domain-containing protein [Verrucomicrobia bacterium]|nr:DUF1080 domain-containing protein [Verrucomicrobiota bacterium]